MTYSTDVYFQTTKPREIIIAELEQLFGVKFKLVENSDGDLFKCIAFQLEISLRFTHGMEESPSIDFSNYPYVIYFYPCWKQVTGEDTFLDSVAVFVATQLSETFHWPSVALADGQEVLAKFG